MAIGVERRLNLSIIGGIAPNGEILRGREKEFEKVAKEIRESQLDPDPYDLLSLNIYVKEGEYRPEKMNWQSPNHCTHTQRCNANQLIDGGRNPRPDGSSSY